MNKLYSAVLSAGILSGCIFPREITKQTVSEPMYHIGYVSKKFYHDKNTSDTISPIEITVEINNKNYTFLHEKNKEYEEFYKDSLVEILAIEHYSNKYRGKKFLSKEFKHITPIFVHPKIPEESDSIYYKKYGVKNE